MELVKELRMSAIILVIGVIFLTGCFFKEKHTVTFKTNGGSEVANISVREGNKIAEPDIPQKDGYVFIGWYLDGEEFNFDEAISEDITLVAKWGAIGSDETDNDADESQEDLETTTSTTTTTKKTTSKKTTTSKTTKKTEEVIKTQAVDESTTTTTSTTTSSSTTSSTTSSSTTAENTELPVLEKKNKAAIYIAFKENDMQIAFVDTEEKGNVESLLTEEEYASLMASDNNKWTYYDHAFEEIEMTFKDDDTFLMGHYDNLIFTDSLNYYALIYDIDSLKWVLTIPSVTVTYEENVPTLENSVSPTIQNALLEREESPTNEEQIIKKTMYFNSMEDALIKTPAKGVITLNKDLSVTPLVISRELTINGNNHTLTNNQGFIFTFDNIADEEAVITIKNLNVKTVSFMNLGSNLNVKSINFANMHVDYQEDIKRQNDEKTIINYNNVQFVLSYE